jgi:hypothetical protein
VDRYIVTILHAKCLCCLLLSLLVNEIVNCFFQGVGLVMSNGHQRSVGVLCAPQKCLFNVDCIVCAPQICAAARKKMPLNGRAPCELRIKESSRKCLILNLIIDIFRRYSLSNIKRRHLTDWRTVLRRYPRIFFSFTGLKCLWYISTCFLRVLAQHHSTDMAVSSM